MAHLRLFIYEIRRLSESAGLCAAHFTLMYTLAYSAFSPRVCCLFCRQGKVVRAQGLFDLCSNFFNSGLADKQFRSRWLCSLIQLLSRPLDLQIIHSSQGLSRSFCSTCLFDTLETDPGNFWVLLKTTRGHAGRKILRSQCVAKASSLSQFSCFHLECGLGMYFPSSQVLRLCFLYVKPQTPTHTKIILELGVSNPPASTPEDNRYTPRQQTIYSLPERTTKFFQRWYHFTEMAVEMNLNSGARESLTLQPRLPSTLPQIYSVLGAKPGATRQACIYMLSFLIFLSFLLFFPFFFFLKQRLFMQPWLVWNLLCRNFNDPLLLFPQC